MLRRRRRIRARTNQQDAGGAPPGGAVPSVTFESRWAADPVAEELLDESLRWQHVHDRLLDGEQRLVAVDAQMVFPDEDPTLDRVTTLDLFLTDRALLLDAYATDGRLNFERIALNRVRRLGPSQRTPAIQELHVANEIGPGGFAYSLVLPGRATSQLFVETLIRQLSAADQLVADTEDGVGRGRRTSP
jgi:hypothetical protein